LPYVIDNLREKPLSPEMSPLLAMYFVPVSRKITLDPLHYSGKGLSALRFDKQMDVVIHDTEVEKLKRVLLSCFFDEGQERSLDPRLLEFHLVSVNFRGNVIGSSVLKFSWISHSYR
jgi:hypothetical protein